MKLSPRIAVAVAMMSISASLYAQTDSAQVGGTVTDASGAVVSGATVRARNDATGFERTVTSNSAGVYTLSGLPAGSYTIAVSFTNFGTYTSQVTLNVGANVTEDAKLGATATQSVVVEAGDEATQVNLTNAEVSQIISQKQVIDLPSLTRDPYTFVELSGTVSTDPNGSTSRGVGVSINGQRAAGTEILLDGVENADNYTASVGQFTPLDSVQEYRIIVNGFDAQYGRASGGIVNLITRQGTNKLHGSLYEFNRISALAANTYNEDALNYENRASGLPNNPADHFTQNQFGYSIGGPIKRDKLFFFNNYEWDRVRSTGQQPFEVPSAAFIAASSPQTQAFFKSYGTFASNATAGPTVAVAGYTGANPLQIVTVAAPVNAGAGAPVNEFFGATRFDYTVNNKLSMFFRAGTFNDNFTPGYVSLSPYNGFNTGQTDFNQSYLYNLNYIISPNLLSSSKVSFSRLNESEPLSTAPVLPSLYLNQANVASSDSSTGNLIALPGYSPLTPGNAIPFGGPQNTYQFIEQLNYTRGKHNISAGGQFIQLRDNRTFGAYDNAVEQVAKSGTALGAALTALQAGSAYSFEVAVNPQGHLPCSYNVAGALVQTPSCSITLPAAAPSFVRENTFNDGNWYVEDQWKVSPRLTLVGGVRWEYYGVQHNTNPNLESNFYLGAGATLPAQIAAGQVLTTPNSPTHGLIAKDLTNYAPRIAFAFDPFGDGKWAIRGGYGISYERNFGNVTYNVIQNPPNYAVIQQFSTAAAPLTLTSSNLGPLAGASGSVALPPSSLRALQQNMPTAYTQQYSLTVEHEISRSDLLSITFSGARGIHQYAIAGVNGLGYGTFVGHPNGSYDTDRINPEYGGINLREANADSYYDGVNVGYRVQNLARYGLNLSVNYTFSHALDNLSSTFSESGNNFNLGYLNPFNPRLDHGNADYDVRHRVVIGGVYEPNFLEFKSNHLLHTVAGGLEFAPIAVVRSGTPFTIYDCTNGLNACPRIVAAPGLQFHGTPTPNGLPNGFNYIALPTASANPFVNSQGDSDFPDQLGGYQNPGLERNQWYAPNNVQFDMGVYKNFHVGPEDRYTVQLRSEFYDILNHHNYYSIVDTADYAEVPNVGVLKGSPGGTVTPSDERRNVQLAVRVQF